MERKRTATDNEKFERAVSRYIEMGMPKKHRLSVEAYRRKCRRAWDACKTDETYSEKFLFDQFSTQYTVPNFGERAYIDDSTWRSVIGRERPKKAITCIAVGRVPFIKSTRDVTVENHRSPRHSLSGTDLWIVALFDVLGFEAAYQRLGIEKLYALYKELIDRIILRPSIDSFGSGQQLGSVMSLKYFRLWVGFHYFSDTILLWCPATPDNFSPFLTRCSDLFIEALNVGLPLRGAISIGEANFSKHAGVFVGQPLIDCARLERSQNWLGIALSSSCSGILEHVDSDLILPYTPPIKPSGDASTQSVSHAGAVLDWPRRARGITGANITLTIDALNTSPNHHLYYDNTNAFVRHSAVHARWNRDERIPVIFGALRNAIVASRLMGRSLPGWASAMIHMVETQKEYGPVVGAALRRAATERLVCAEVDRLPSGPRQFLTEIESIVDGRSIDLESLAIATIEARFGICDLDRYYKQVLENPEDSKQIKSSLLFLHSLLETAEISDIPSDISAAERKILSMARTFAFGESLPINAENFLAAVMYSASTGIALEPVDQKRLELIAVKGEPWSHLADAVNSVLANEPIHVPKGSLPSEVATTVQVFETFIANQRREFYAADRAIARVQKKVDIDVLQQLVSCLQCRGEQLADEKLDEILNTMDSGGHPHDAAARFVHVLLEEPKESVIPGGISEEVYWFLRFLKEVARQGRSEIPIDLLGRMIGRVRAGRTGSDCYGLALFGLLMSDEGEGLHFREFFEKLVSCNEHPAIPKDVSDNTAQAMEAILRFVKREDEWIELRDIANDIANSRLQDAKLDERYVRRIREISEGEEPFSSFAQWLSHLTHGTEGLPLPNDLPEYIMDCVETWRLKSIARCSPEEIMELRNAAVRCRLQRKPFEKSYLKTIRLLSRAGGLYKILAKFIRKLSKPHAMPRVPMGLPSGLLSAFASARREALAQEGAVVFLPRRKE